MAEWYCKCLDGAESLVAVPIRDPRESRLLGVLCFESRIAGAFHSGDIFYLERFAQQAGAILREAGQAGLVEKLEEFARSAPSVQEDTFRRDSIGGEIANYLLADAATIWAMDFHNKEVTRWAQSYRDDTVLPGTAEFRVDGWTNELLRNREIRPCPCSWPFPPRSLQNSSITQTTNGSDLKPTRTPRPIGSGSRHSRAPRPVGSITPFHNESILTSSQPALPASLPSHLSSRTNPTQSAFCGSNGMNGKMKPRDCVPISAICGSSQRLLSNSRV